jgi:hypothetical protein
MVYNIYIKYNNKWALYTDEQYGEYTILMNLIYEWWWINRQRWLINGQ